MERKRFYQYLWSAILTSLSGILCVQIDGIIVSHLLGAEAFAAIGVLMPLLQIQLTLCLLIGVGGALRLSFAIGEQNEVKSQQIFRLTTCLLLGCSLPFVILSGWSAMVAGRFCHEATLMPLATDYARVLLLSAPVYLLLQGSGAMVRAEGFPKRILWAMVLANVLNLGMDVLFIQVFHWGIAGAGWATTISNIIALVIILTRPRHSTTSILSAHIHLRLLPSILLAGAPIALGSVAMFVRLSYLTSATSAHLGAEGMITLSLLLSVFLVVNLLAGGTTQALQPLAGQYIGQGDTAAMYRTCRRSLRFTAISSVVVTLVVIVLARPLCLLYGIDSLPETGTLSALRIFALCYAFYSVGYVLMVIHQILGNKTKAMIIAVVQALMVIPVFALALTFDSRLTWWAFPVSELISLIFISILSNHELRHIYTTPTCD
ncbi:MAG: polysaccharide biosynthesis C-terminal domain-containing protein [Paludibacteraceae bacterium]|nr:polysaccharide biosynthesis C-terminal domain-containing protein [Paludibacteraceae bacterium]